jgi:PAS domain S-box-containing protein
MDIQSPSIEIFLDAILAGSAKRSGNESIAEVINNGLKVFREFPGNNGVMLFLLDDEEFNFRFSAALPNENNDTAQLIFNTLAEKGSIGTVLASGKAQFIPDEICGVRGFIIIPLSVPSAAVGLVILAAELPPDDWVLLRLCELSAYQFASELNNTKLLQRLTYNQIVLEQKVSARTIHLEQTQRELKTILDCVQTGILIIDAKSGEITAANPTAEEMIGETSSGIIGKPYALYLEEIETSDTTEISSEQRNVESTLVRANGEIILILQTSVFVNLGTRQVIIESFVDITERQRSEEAARQALFKQKELAELKSNFVSMVSHEFRTPLTTILSYTQIMQNYRDKLSGDVQDKYLQNIKSAVSRMTSMLNDILFVGKSNSGALTVHKKDVPLFEFCTHLLDELRMNEAEKHVIHFDFDFPAETITTDEKLLRQILINLLTNALKYSPNSESVELLVGQTENSVYFEVKDTGIGIPQEYFKNLFESFRRADNVGNIAGTGLGLAIVKQSVDLLGGSITVESIENQGTTFRVELPIR